jgi:hypothetical protein
MLYDNPPLARSIATSFTNEEEEDLWRWLACMQVVDLISCYVRLVLFSSTTTASVRIRLVHAPRVVEGMRRRRRHRGQP